MPASPFCDSVRQASSDQVARHAITDAGLAAVDQEVIRIAHGAGTQVLAAGFGDRQGKDCLAAADIWQPAALLFVVAQLGNTGGNDVGMQGQRPVADAGPGKFFTHHRGMAEIATTTEFLWQGHAQQPFATGLEKESALKVASGLPLQRVRLELALKKASHSGAKHLMIFAVDSALNVHPETFGHRPIA